MVGVVVRRGWCRGSEVDRCSEGREADTGVYIPTFPHRLKRCDTMSGYSHGRLQPQVFQGAVSRVALSLCLGVCAGRGEPQQDA